MHPVKNVARLPLISNSRQFNRFMSFVSIVNNSFSLFASVNNSILYIEGEKCMIFPKVHRGKNEHSLQKYIYYFFHGRE
jgi:hypothetical protein